MKTRLLVPAIVAALLTVVAPTSSVAQVAGTWVLSAEGPRGPQTMTLVLEVQGDEVEGTLSMAPRGGRRVGGRPPEVVLREGSVDGTSFRFTVTLSMRGNSITQEFEGSVDADEMSGTITGPRGEVPFSGARSN